MSRSFKPVSILIQDVDDTVEQNLARKLRGIRDLSTDDQKALTNFLQGLGVETTAQLQFLQSSDIENSTLPLVLRRKLLLIKEFVDSEGSLPHTTSFEDISNVVSSHGKLVPTPDLRATTTTTIQDEIIELNVGGFPFTTTRKTLCRVPGSVLEAMFSGRFPNGTNRKEDGTYFIDRNGRHFSHILDYLRVGGVVSLPTNREDRDALLMEADFFGLDNMVRAIEAPPLDLTQYLPEDIVAIWHAETKFREIFVQNAAAALHSHEGLISLFDDKASLPLCYTPRGASEDMPLLMDFCGTKLIPDQPITVPSLRSFLTNFNRSHANVLNRLLPILKTAPVIVAGGSVLRALSFGDGLRPSEWWDAKLSDIDLFIHSSTPAEATDIARRVFYAVAADRERWVILRSNGVITMHSWQDNDGELEHAQNKIQIILRLYDSPAEVLFGFDVDSCACAFDGERVLITPRAKSALEGGVNVLNPLHSWPNRPSYELRLAKYAKRGFAVGVPGLDLCRVDYEKISATDLPSLKGLARLVKVAVAMNKDSSSKEILDPLHNMELRPHVKPTMSPCEMLVNGYWAEENEDQIKKSLILPPVYCEDREYLLHHLWKADAWRDLEDFPVAEQIRDQAWATIEDAGENAAEGMPRLLVESWTNEKTSREYLNDKMEKVDVDTIYYDHAYCRKTK